MWGSYGDEYVGLVGSNVVEDGGSMFLKHFGTPYLQVHRV